MTSQKRAPASPGSIDTYPVLPLRDIVVSPHDRAALRRPREVDPRARRGDEGRQVHPARHPGERRPTTTRRPTHLHDRHAGLGLQLLKLPDGTVKVLVEGVARAKVVQKSAPTSSTRPRPRRSADDALDKVEVEALARSVRQRVRELRQAEQEDLARDLVAVARSRHPKLADTVASHLAVKIADKQGSSRPRRSRRGSRSASA